MEFRKRPISRGRAHLQQRGDCSTSGEQKLKIWTMKIRIITAFQVPHSARLACVSSCPQFESMCVRVLKGIDFTFAQDVRLLRCWRSRSSRLLQHILRDARVPSSVYSEDIVLQRQVQTAIVYTGLLWTHHTQPGSISVPALSPCPKILKQRKARPLTHRY